MITSLTLTDFRNHESSRINTGDAKAVIITGSNGSGKTSILEAISMFSGGGTLRGDAPGDMVRISGGGMFGIVAELSNGTKMSVSFEMGDQRRKARIDNDTVPFSEMARHLRLVWLTPREDRLFVDSASDRRAFFDRLVAAFDPTHAGRVARLAKLLSERAFALKNGEWTAQDADGWLSGIEKQLTSTAVAVAAARVKYAGEINYFFNKCTDPYHVTISGILEQKLSAGASALDVEKEYAEYLSTDRTLVTDKMIVDGAHRTDFGMFNNSLDMNVQMTSTGQQKSALLALILAHTKLVRMRFAAATVILLDEAAAHLDADARASLFSGLADADAQIWATGLDPVLFTGLGNTVFISCEAGKVYA
ncbi:MAG: AAA family ATPase [Alphaproteobacteria bacterium]|nr:AAA family ATPase [Alphaproteobacteria bacterium]